MPATPTLRSADWFAMREDYRADFLKAIAGGPLRESPASEFHRRKDRQLFTIRALAKAFERLVETEAADFPSRWEFFQRAQELPDILVCGHEQEHTVEPPAPVIHGVVGLFKEARWFCKTWTRATSSIAPAILRRCARAVPGKQVVAEGGQVAVVAEVEEGLGDLPANYGSLSVARFDSISDGQIGINYHRFLRR